MFLSTSNRSPLRSRAFASDNSCSQFGQVTLAKCLAELPDAGSPTRTVYPQRGQGASRWWPLSAGDMLPVGTPNGSTATVRSTRNRATNPAITTSSARNGETLRNSFRSGEPGA